MTNRDLAIQDIAYLLRYHPHALRFVGAATLLCLNDKPNVPKREWSNYLDAITGLFMLAAQAKPVGEPMHANVDGTGRIVYVSFPTAWMKEIERVTANAVAG